MRCLKNVALKIYTSGPIYRKMYAVWKGKLCSIARFALDRSALSALDREVCT